MNMMVYLSNYNFDKNVIILEIGLYLSYQSKLLNISILRFRKCKNCKKALFLGAPVILHRYTLMYCSIFINQ